MQNPKAKADSAGLPKGRQLAGCAESGGRCTRAGLSRSSAAPGPLPTVATALNRQSSQPAGRCGRPLSSRSRWRRCCSTRPAPRRESARPSPSPRATRRRAAPAAPAATVPSPRAPTSTRRPARTPTSIRPHSLSTSSSQARSTASAARTSGRSPSRSPRTGRPSASSVCARSACHHLPSLTVPILELLLPPASPTDISLEHPSARLNPTHFWFAFS